MGHQIDVDISPLKLLNSPAHFLRIAPAALSFDQLSLRAGRAFGALATCFGKVGEVGATLKFLSLFQLIEEAFQGQFAIGSLRSGIACNHPQTTGLVDQCYRSRDFIDILPPRPGRTRERLYQILRPDVKLRHSFLKHSFNFKKRSTFRKGRAQRMFSPVSAELSNSREFMTTKSTASSISACVR